jgi:hypothetical protein
VNVEHLRKNIGQSFRLWPRVILAEDSPPDALVSVLTSGPPILQRKKVPTEYLWQLVDVSSAGVTLHCSYTGHTLILGTDNVREYRTPDYLMLRCQFILDGTDVRIEPI